MYFSPRADDVGRASMHSLVNACGFQLVVPSSFRSIYCRLRQGHIWTGTATWIHLLRVVLAVGHQDILDSHWEEICCKE